MNENGERYAEFCALYNLVISSVSLSLGVEAVVKAGMPTWLDPGRLLFFLSFHVDNLESQDDNNQHTHQHHECKYRTQNYESASG